MNRYRESKTLRFVFVALALGIVAWVIIGVVQASPGQPNKCFHYNDLVVMLESQYDEHPKADAVIKEHAAQLFVSLDKATWSFVLVRTDGVACLIASGTDWSDVPLPLPGKDS